jgi:hypothetical protein
MSGPLDILQPFTPFSPFRSRGAGGGGPAGPIAFTGLNPVMLPTQAWEETAVYEPTLIYEDGVFKMWYSGGWDNPALGYATSTDGSVFTKHTGPVLGQGGSSIAGKACRSNVVKVSGTYYCYYADAVPDANIKVATSADGIAWTAAGTPIAKDALAGYDGWANTFVFKEGATWYMFAEAHAISGFPQWSIFLLSSADGITWAFLNSSNPLTTLRRGTGGMYGGPNMAGKLGSVSHLYYHACPTPDLGNPTDIFHATSTDLITWTQTTDPILVHTINGPEGGDQIADPAVLEVQGRVYMWYDGTYNDGETAGIGVAYYDGALADAGPFVRLADAASQVPAEVWEMHEASGNRAGAINGLTLTDNGGVGSTTNGGRNVATIVDAQSLTRASQAEIQLANENFAFAGWVNISANTGAPVLFTKWTASQAQIYVYLEASGWRTVMYKTLDGLSYGDVYASNYGLPAANTWHFVQVWHNATAKLIGTRVNNGVPNTSPFVDGPSLSGTAPLMFGSDGSSNAVIKRMERWAFWKGRVPSTEEFDAIYNAGAGKDYPY